MIQPVGFSALCPTLKPTIIQPIIRTGPAKKKSLNVRTKYLKWVMQQDCKFFKMPWTLSKTADNSCGRSDVYQHTTQATNVRVNSIQGICPKPKCLILIKNCTHQQDHLSLDQRYELSMKFYQLSVSSPKPINNCRNSGMKVFKHEASMS